MGYLYQSDDAYDPHQPDWRAAFAFLTSFDNFPMSLFLAEGDNATLPVVMFQYIEFDLKPTILAMSTLVILLTIAVMLVIERTIGVATFVGLRQQYSVVAAFTLELHRRNGVRYVLITELNRIDKETKT